MRVALTVAGIESAAWDNHFKEWRTWTFDAVYTFAATEFGQTGS